MTSFRVAGSPPWQWTNLWKSMRAASQLVTSRASPRGACKSDIASHELRRAAGIEAPLSVSGLPKRLYQPIPSDRQAEHAPDDDNVDWQPVYADDKRCVVCRYNRVLN